VTFLPTTDDSGPLLGIFLKPITSVVKLLLGTVYCGLPEEPVVRLKVNGVPAGGSWLILVPRDWDRRKKLSMVFPFWVIVAPCVSVPEAAPFQMFPPPLTVALVTTP